jgi:hypothetical protein
VSVPRLDQSSMARATRAARHNQMLQQQVRQARLISAVILGGILIALGVIGSGLGWW